MEIRRFSTLLTVRVTDINYGGHLGNDTVLSYFHEARVRYLRALGVSELSIGEDTSLTQTEAFVEYKAEAFLGDELTILVWIDNISRARFRANYEIVRRADGRLIAAGYTTLAAFNYQTHKPQRVPESFVTRVLDFQNS